jgi:(p)ppGpp synthase/HD superfamily hydrolase
MKKDYPDQTPGSVMAAKVRKEANKLNPEQREAHERAGRELIRIGKLQLMLESVSLAARVHDGQLRKDGTPYVAHPFRATLILVNLLGVSDSDTIILMNLHDAYEDNPDKISLGMIAEKYGVEMAEWVGVISKEPAPEKDSKQRLEDYFAKLQKAPVPVRIAKVADQLDNWFDSFHLPEKQRLYHQDKVRKTLKALQPDPKHPYLEGGEADFAVFDALEKAWEVIGE